jgi:predicted alpha/beta superfamily hydrolase
MKTLPFILALVCLLASRKAVAQDVPGNPDTLVSKALDEKRAIRIVLPDHYNPKTEKYDVLYVLDAEDDARKILNIERLAEQYGFIPRCIIVNIYTIWFNDREKDFTPTYVESSPTSGCADRFLRFLGTELIPYIDHTYPTSGENTLYGHSLGGLFSLYSLIKAPQLFSSWIITDPSCWWDGGVMNRMLEKELPLASLAGKTVWIGSRTGKAHHDMGIDGMDSIFEHKAPSGLLWSSVTYPNESHFSLIFKNAYDGLKFCYTGYNPGSMEFYPGAGIVQKNKPFTFYFFNPLPDSPAIRYTTDGSEPNNLSPKMSERDSILNSTHLAVRAFCLRERYDTTLHVRFAYGDALLPGPKPEHIVPGGWHYSYYEGSWDSIPDFDRLHPLLSGVVGKQFTLSRLPRNNNFGLLVEGWLNIKEDGYYTFLLTSDEGAKLFVNNRPIIDENGAHWRLQRSFMVPMKKGFYPIRIDYYQKWADMALDLTFIPPGAPGPQMIPFEDRYYSN